MSNPDLDANKAMITANTVVDQLPPLTSQEAHFVAALSTGISLPIAATRSGIAVSTARSWANRPEIQQHLAKLAEERADALSQTVKYTLEDAHLDIEMGKRMSANAMEWYRGVELHMRLHGLGVEKKETRVTLDVNTVKKREQLEVLDDAALIELAGDQYERLQPEDHESST